MSLMVGKDEISRQGMEKEIHSLNEQSIAQRDYHGEGNHGGEEF